MTEARGRQQWARTGQVAALLFNAFRDPDKTEPMTADDFNPFVKPGSEQAKRKKGVPLNTETLHLLKGFVK